MSFTSFHPDELESKGVDLSRIVSMQPEGLDSEHSFYYQDSTGSGFDDALRYGHDVPVERGVSYNELKKMPQMDDSKLAQYIDEEDADEQNDRYEDREDYQSNQDLLSEGNEIFRKELSRYNKAHDVKSQSVHYSDYP